ncbi:Eco57I restriction-modification methylase domain-containing protein [Sphingomonas sp.]|uniref:Eco57I restriction-modification methylase domain-containing protein n=1 Tax=Sphingomonas sp. TaxID=28214 RepID=UPI0038A390DC
MLAKVLMLGRESVVPSGGLFTEYFLSEGVQQSASWLAIDDATVAALRAELASLVGDFQGRRSPNEAETERDLIEPVLRLLGWTDFLPQQTAAKKGRSDVPDYLLFASATAKASVAPLPSNEKYKFGASILEAKAWELALDKPNGREGTPSTQLLRYLGRVEVESNGAIRFGILTNGRLWRLYDQKGRTSRLEAFVEIDLFEALGLLVPAEERTGSDPARADHLLRLFLWLLGRDAFQAAPSGRTRLEQAIADSRSFEARVTDQLADTVFDPVFPGLANALAAADPERPEEIGTGYLAEVREAALTWLYRLLFVLYAEDRDLIPTRRWHGGLRAMREQIAQALDSGSGLSSFPEHDGDLRRMWQRIDNGDEGLRLPPYNGGLFKRVRSPLLERALIPDRDFALLLDPLSRERTGASPRLINYRDLNVQHLGSVYERLLEFDLVEEDGRIVARPQAFARKTSGSYYTPEELVGLVLRRAVGPLLQERRAAFEQTSERLRADRRPIDERRRELRVVDPANAFLDLKICDPAMGSGHFLVSLVDYLADEVMKATEEAAFMAEWCDYESPLLERLSSIRDRIEAEAKEHGWAVHSEQLVDRQLVRRIILKRVVHGVDKNPMAVELAKLSLWLHTFTVGAPLSFLDHHLRIGDSLFGEWVRPALDRFAEVGLFKSQAVQTAELAIGEMQQIEELTDADIAEVNRSAETYDSMKSDTAELRQLLNVLQGFRWIGQSTEKARKDAKQLRKEADRLALSDPKASAAKDAQAAKLRRRSMALEALLEGEFGEPGAAIDQCYGRIGDPDPARAQIAEAIAVAQDSNFLHWQVAFPGVWRDWASRTSPGGFDAVIGNPPWDRLKMQEVEWFAARKPEIAYATRAADRKRMVEELKDANDPLADDYDRASRFAGMAARMAGLPPARGGQYPLLGGGDVNLYSLFVERAARLVKPNGLVGLLVPSGISGDLNASAFFRSISTTGRLGSLLDYENRGIYFPDVHRSFKFSVLCFGGETRSFNAAECGFFLTSTDDEKLAAQTFPLSPDDFASVNPNSGTAPIFRSPRDADLVTAIYERVPVLVDHRLPEATRPWRVRYLRMFDMTNDSGLFHTADELEADGWYPVEIGRWRKGKAEAVPLYEGKMIQAFDHRAANIVINPDNLHRPAQPQPASDQEHGDPTWVPTPQFFVKAENLPALNLPGYALGFKEITAPTNVRTFISALLPAVAFGNKVPIFCGMPKYAEAACALVANFNSIVFDYATRQKVQGQTLNLFIVEQLPVLSPASYERRFGKLTAREIVAREVLRLTYTAHDIAPFARDMGHVDAKGEVLPPFAWDEVDRR